MNPSQPSTGGLAATWPLAAGMVLLALSVPEWAAAAESPRERLPNIVLILADDMGYGDPGCYNEASRIPTPHMDRVAAEGMRFTDAHSPSAVCTPTRYGLITGRYGWRTLRKGVIGGYSPPLIQPGEPTLPSLLKERGYRSACIGKWHIGATFHDREGRPTSREKEVDFRKPVTGGPTSVGFDQAYWNAGCGTCAPPYGFIEDEHFVASRFSHQAVPHGDHGMAAEGWSHARADLVIAGKARAYIRQAADHERPFFLYLAPNAPHEPCVEEVVPEFARGKSKAGSRGDLVWLFDWIVGQVDEALTASGQRENTVIIVTSDNGALPGDFKRGEGGKRLAGPGRNWLFERHGHASNGELRGWKAHIWEGGHRVPLIVRWPGRIEAGTQAGQLFSLTDFVATLTAVAGAPAMPEAGARDSVNQLPVLLGEVHDDAPPRRSMIQHSSHGVLAIRRGDWKLIAGTRGSGGWPPPRDSQPVPGAPGQLYHLRTDPAEQENQWDREPDRVRELNQLLEEAR
ncbi:arylsulfatase [Haloferula sp. A504]|uniref:arylsulfatase n=1 Tax=Haloferula sp. A504 TaxID=3373601 RepID=UPI0031C5573C|nr:arylsulfatase [Verrucomicrobiaceae bacterium E54]